MVNYNAKNGQYYTASWFNPGGAARGVIDATTNRLVQTIPLGGGDAFRDVERSHGACLRAGRGQGDGGDGTIHVYAPN